MASASGTLRPLIASVTRRTLRGGCPMFLAMARVCIATLSSPLANRRGTLAPAASVTAEFTRQRKLPQLMADHVFRDINRHMLLTIVHADGKSHHLWNHRRSA